MRSDPTPGPIDLPPSRRKARQRGFSLVEAILALSVLAVGVLASVSALASSTISEVTTAEETRAIRAALARLEAVSAYDPNLTLAQLQTSLTASSMATFSVDELSRPIIGGSATSHGSLTTDLTNPNLLRVTATVRWMSRGQLRSISLNNAVAETIP